MKATQSLNQLLPRCFPGGELRILYCQSFPIWTASEMILEYA